MRNFLATETILTGTRVQDTTSSDLPKTSTLLQGISKPSLGNGVSLLELKRAHTQPTVSILLYDKHLYICNKLVENSAAPPQKLRVKIVILA